MYEPTIWVDDSAPGLSASELNRMEAGIAAGLDFTEAWQELTIPSAGAWREVDLSGYGVPEGGVAWIVFLISVGGPLYGGARAVGSTIQRRAHLHGESAAFTLPVMTTGADATVELYSEDTDNVKAYLIGYAGV